MKLIKCYVSSFGKIKDREFDFTSGLNTIKEENGWGKTTLATFIKAMFYGLDGTNKRNVNDNERKKYKPWNSTELFGGYVEFEWGGKEFKIERYFGNKETDDTVALYDATTGKRFNNTENLGKRIFEIDEEGFLSTTYFSQKDFEIKSNASLTAKFNSVCEYDDGSFDKAIAKIEQKYKTYKYSGDRGLIPQTKNEIFDLSQKIARAGNMTSVAVQLKEEINGLDGQVKILEKECADLTDKVTEAGRAEAIAVKKERYKELLNEKNNLIQEKNRCDAILKGRILTDSQVKEYSDCVNDFSKVDQGISLLEEEIDRVNTESEQNQNKPLSKKSIICASIIALLFLIEGVLTISSNVVLGVVGFVLFALCSVGVLIMLIPHNSKTKNDPYKDIIRERSNRLNEFTSLKEQYQNKINGFYAYYQIPQNLDGLTAINYVVELGKKSREIDVEIKAIEEKLKAFDGDVSVTKETQVIAVDVNSLRETLRFKQSLLKERSSQLSAKRINLSNYEQASDELNDLEVKKKQLEDLVEQYKADYDILFKTSQFLKQADENLKVKYRAPLQNSLDKYLKLIDGGEKQVKIDVDLNVTAIEKGKEFDTGYYSKGYQNLFEICKRFALTDVLFTGEKPFIILDDPFYNLDDQKVSSAIDLVRKLSDEYQIIYFVCHESRRA